MKPAYLALIALAACPDGGGGPPPGPRLQLWVTANEGQNARLVDVEPEPY